MLRWRSSLARRRARPCSPRRRSGTRQLGVVERRFGDHTGPRIEDERCAIGRRPVGGKERIKRVQCHALDRDFQIDHRCLGLLTRALRYTLYARARVEGVTQLGPPAGQRSAPTKSEELLIDFLYTLLVDLPDTWSDLADALCDRIDRYLDALRFEPAAAPADCD